MDQMKDVLKEQFKKEMLNEYPNPYFFHGKDAETAYADYIQGVRSFTEVSDGSSLT